MSHSRLYDEATGQFVEIPDREAFLAELHRQNAEAEQKLAEGLAAQAVTGASAQADEAARRQAAAEASVKLAQRAAAPAPAVAAMTPAPEPEVAKDAPVDMPAQVKPKGPVK